MATTSNFGWTTPADTDLVKDGAAAIRTLGNGIDASLVDLKGGTTGQVLSKASNTDLDFSWVAQDDSNAIQNALLTTTGDTIYASAASTPARLGIGTAGQVLAVNSGATAPEWKTISSGGMTLITTTTFDNSVSTYTYSSLGSYKHLMIVVDDLSRATTTSIDTLAMQFNGVTTGFPYNSASWGNLGTTTFDRQAAPAANYLNLATYAIAGGNSTSSERGILYAWIYDYAGSTRKVFSGVSYNRNDQDLGDKDAYYTNQGFWDSTSAITSLTIFSVSASNLKTGTLKLYGVS
jgi:hypothetical protein